MNKRHYEHTLPNIRGSLSNTYNGSNMLRLPLTVIQCQCRNLSYMVCPGRFTPLLFLGMLTRGGVYSFRFFHPVDTSAQLEFSIRYMELRLQNISCHCFRFHLQGCITEIM